MRLRVCLSLVLCLGLLPSCALPASVSSGASSGVTAVAPGVLADYLLKVNESFGIKAVDPEHKSTVDAQVAGFEADLKNGTVDSYYQNPGFSVLLAAGSEGSFFNSKEGIETIGQSGAVFAKVVVFDPGVAPKLFNGQYSNGRFYFAGTETAAFSSLNTSYLISLDLNLETKIFKGQLAAGSEGSFIQPGTGLPAELAAGSEGSFLREPSRELLEAKKLEYQSVLQRNATQGEAFARKVNEFKIVPPEFPLGLAWTETYARLQRAYPDEITLMNGQMRGLPRGQLDDAFRLMLERYTARYIADCGSPPPDSGKLYPQKSGEEAPIPPGYQSEELDKVIAELPDFAAELKALGAQRLLPHLFEPAYVALLNKYRGLHPEVFNKHQWTDAFAPPPCVKARRLGPTPGSGPGGGPPGGGGPGGAQGGPPPARPPQNGAPGRPMPPPAG